MKFVHEDPEFPDLLRVVAGARAIALALVEKEYWVTHALWALHEPGFDIWFKGGTPLSKGFGLIERFSEDLDLKVEPGRQVDMPRVRSWKSEGRQATDERRASFEWLASNLDVAGARVVLDAEASADSLWRTAHLYVFYPALHAATLPSGMRPYVLMEVGSARVVPFVPRDMTSFVHDHVAAAGLLPDYVDNRPRAVRCVHPLVTLLEKLDAIGRRASRDDVEAATYVRHYEDAACIAGQFETLPALSGYPNVRALADEMRDQHQLRALPAWDDSSFDPSRLANSAQIRAAYRGLGPMYWGPRLALDSACDAIRTWVRTHLA